MTRPARSHLHNACCAAAAAASCLFPAGCVVIGMSLPTMFQAQHYRGLREAIFTMLVPLPLPLPLLVSSLQAAW
jgi:hypothetical protein